MTREEKIKQAARAYFNKVLAKNHPVGFVFGDFVRGAKWADEHPRKLFIVTRCEEHSDYVERVFIDQAKAEKYCNQFNNDENAYGRDITEIEITL